MHWKNKRFATVPFVLPSTSSSSSSHCYWNCICLSMSSSLRFVHRYYTSIHLAICPYWIAWSIECIAFIWFVGWFHIQNMWFNDGLRFSIKDVFLRDTKLDIYVMIAIEIGFLEIKNEVDYFFLWSLQQFSWMSYIEGKVDEWSQLKIVRQFQNPMMNWMSRLHTQGQF